MQTITLPEFCLTLLPPWMQCTAVEHPNAKRLENRGLGVAHRLVNWRGVVGLSQSKGFSSQYGEDDAIEDAIEAEQHNGLPYMRLGRAREWKPTAGKLWLAAELLDVLSPEQAEGRAWHVPGQWGLIWGRIWLLEPIACAGAMGAWRPRWCSKCLHIYADAAQVPQACRSCGAVFPENFLDDEKLFFLNAAGREVDRPALRVVRELKGTP